MKQSIFKYLFIALLFLGLATSCYDPLTADVTVSSVRKGKDFIASLSLVPMENDVQTKSQYTGSDAGVLNWNLFIYDAGGTRVGAYYKETSGTDDGRIRFKVRLDETYHYFAVANVGDMVSSAPTTMAGLSSFAVTFSGGNQQTSSIAANLSAMPAAGTADVKFTTGQYHQSGGDLELNIPLTRLVSRYDISVIKGPHDNQPGLQDWDFDVTSLTLNGVNTVKPFVEASYGSSNNTVNDRATAADLVLLNSDNSITVYPLENIVNVPVAISSPWQKVPSTVGNSLYPSFITVKGTATLKDGSGKTKEVTYNFYLGQNATDDFKVFRNTVNTVKLYLSDENIWNDTQGRWKVEPGSFNDDRSIRFTRNLTEATSSQNPVLLRAGQSLDEAITRKVGSTDKNFKYNVSFGGGLAPSGNTVRMSVLDANSVKQTSLSSIDFSSLSLVAEDGIDAEGYVRIYTIATPDPGSNLLNGHIKEDKLYVKVYNAWMDVDQTELVWDWNEIAAKTANVRSTVNWGSNGSSLSSVYTVTPLSTTSPSSNPGIAVSVTPVNVNSLVTDATTNLVFSAAGLEDKTVVLRQRSKPQVYIPGNTDGFVNLEWEPGQNGVGDKKTVTFKANESWEIVWDSSYSSQQSHWSYSPTSGDATSGDGTVSIDIYPTGTNGSITAIPGSFKIIPKRNNVQVLEGAFVVNLSHKKSAPSMSVSPESLTWSWNQYGDNDQGRKSISILGNVNWTASFQNASDANLWTLSATSGSGNATLTVYPKAANSDMDTPADKQANIVIHCTSSVEAAPEDKVVVLKQTKHPTVKVPALPLDSEGNLVWEWNETDNKGIDIVADTGWQITMSSISASGIDGSTSNWEVSPASGSASAQALLHPKTQNTNEEPRRIQVTVSATDGSLGIPSVTFYALQRGKPADPNISIDPNVSSLQWHWYEGTSSALKTIAVSANVEWEIEVTGSSANKFYCDYDLINTNIINIYPLQVNDGAAISGVTLIIRSKDAGQSSLTKTISLSQTKSPSMTVNPLSLNWPWDLSSPLAQTVQVNISSDEDYTWSAAFTSGSGSFSLSDASGNSGASFTVTRSESNNDEENPVTGNIRVSMVGDFGSQSAPYVDVPLSQDRKTANFITAEPNSLTFDDLANNSGSNFDVYKKKITVTSNGSWSFTAPLGYAVDRNSGDAGSTDVYICPTSANTTYDDRNGGFTITGPGGVQAYVSLTHEGIQVNDYPEYYVFSITSWGNSMRFTGDEATFFPSLEALYKDEYNTDVWVDVPVGSGDWSVYSRTDIGGYGEYHDDNPHYMTITSGATSGNTDDKNGTVVFQYTGSYTPNDSFASANFSIGGYPYLTAEDVNIGWNDTGNHNYNNVNSNYRDIATMTVSTETSWLHPIGFIMWNATSSNPSYSPRTGTMNVHLSYLGVELDTSFDVIQAGQEYVPSYTYTIAVKESDSSEYGTYFDVSATGSLKLEAWAIERFTDGSSTPDAVFTPFEVTGSCTWTPNAVLDDWSDCSGGTVNANASYEPLDKVGVYTVTYGAAVNSPVDVYIEVVDISHYEYDITLDGDHSPVELDYGETVVAQYLRREISYWHGPSDWSNYGASIGVYDSKYLTTGSHNLVSRGIVSESVSGTGTVTITNANKTGSVVTGYAKGSFGDASAAITLNPKPVVTTIYKVVTKGKKADSDDDPSSTVAIYDNESVELSAKLYSSDDNGNTWTEVSSSPSSYSKFSGYNVINTSTGGAISTGTGVYRGTFTGDYDISSYSDVTITVSEQPVTKIYKVETRVNNESSYEATFGNGLSTWYSYLVPLSATLYSSDDNGNTWTEVSSSPDDFVNVEGTSVLDLSYDPAYAVARGTGYYRGVFDGYTIDSNSDVEVTVHEINYSNFSIAFDREWFAVGKSTKVHAYIDSTYDGTTTNIKVTDDAQFSVLAGALSISDSTVTSTGNYYQVCYVRGTYGSLQADASVVVNSLIDLVFDSSDYHFGSLSTINTVDVIGKWSGGQEIPITEYFPFEIEFNNWSGNHNLAGRVTWSVPSFDGTKYSSMPSLSISRPTEYHSNYVKTAAGRYDFPVSVRVPTFGKSYDLNTYINLVEQDIDYSPKTVQSGIQMTASFTVALGLDVSGELWNYYGSNPIYVDYTWGNYPSTSYGNWNIYHSSGSNQLDIRYSGPIDNEGQVEREIQIGRQDATVWKFKVYVDIAGSQGTHIQIVSAGVVE